MTIKVKAADTDVIKGGKQYATLVDETHVFAAMPRAAAMFLETRGALAVRPDGFFMQITTQSKTPPAGVLSSSSPTPAMSVGDFNFHCYRCSMSCRRRCSAMLGGKTAAIRQSSTRT